ncbi:MAG: alpha/beta hydrolase [Acidobacteria bacterium]|nr:alpha/beta hydrolase [Acidobacteriota bacterium]
MTSTHHFTLVVTSRDMLGTALSIAGLLAFSWLALVALLALQERRLIFFPSRTLAAAPADYGLRAEELSITAADGVTLHGWWIEGPGDRVLIWYHGNAGNIGDRLHNARWFVDRLGVDVVLVDYRGYGRSRGTPDEDGVYLDGLAIYDAVAARSVRAEDIVLFGRSLGGAVAIETALRRPAGALVLESVFRSVPALAREHYWFVPSAVIRTRMDNESKLRRVRTPTLVLHGDRDGIVPLAHGRRLFELAARPARLHVIAGAGHNDTYLVGGEPYAGAWAAFLRESRRVDDRSTL